MPRKNKKAQGLSLSLFMLSLAILSVSQLVIAFHVPPVYGAPLVFALVLSWIVLLSFNPYKRISLLKNKTKKR
jgi:hypothetical protein